MAELEFINLKTGDRKVINRDGSESHDNVPAPSIEWCDKGQHYASKLHGQVLGADDLSMLWICIQCQ